MVPAGSLSRGGDVTVTELALSFISIHVSVSVFMALSTVFPSINSPDNSSLSLSLSPFFWYYFCLIGPLNYISL